jgi:hypothetical protein
MLKNKLNICPDISCPWCGDGYEQAVILNFYSALGLQHPEEFTKRCIDERKNSSFFRSGQEINNMSKDQLERYYTRLTYSQTGKTTRSILHFIYHRFFLEQKDAIFVDLQSKSKQQVGVVRNKILFYLSSLVEKNMLEMPKSSSFFVYASENSGWWPQQKGNIVFDGS